jgi:hypothetical protein
LTPEKKLLSTEMPLSVFWMGPVMGRNGALINQIAAGRRGQRPEKNSPESSPQDEQAVHDGPPVGE